MHLSVRTVLTSLWILLLAICVGLAFFLVELYEQSSSTQIKQMDTLVEQAGTAINKRYSTYLANSDVRTNRVNDVEHIRELNLLLTLVLAQFDGVEGGFWTSDDGFFAYAFPSYGLEPGAKKDLPTTELKVIAQVNQDALSSGAPRMKNIPRERRSLVLYAAPIDINGKRAVLWTMGWVTVKNSQLLNQVITALSILFLCSLLSGIWLFAFLYQWSCKVSALEKAITSATTIEQLPQLSTTGHRELDQVVLAMNQLSTKLRESQAASEKLSKELARADKLSAMGRMVGGFAHEIRNPLATIHLSVENALEGATGKQERLLKNVLLESQSLQTLVQKFLSVSEIHALKPVEVVLDSWLAQRIESCRMQASEKSIKLELTAPAERWSLDSESVSRAITNLLLNAIQHTPQGGLVSLTATISGGICVFAVEDSGDGVPEDKREIIFEPLYTSRAEGTGLGLTMVREIAQAHGGDVRCTTGKEGARFEMEIPWLRS